MLLRLLHQAGETGAEGEEGELYTITGLGLSKQVADVRLDGGHGESEVVADLLIGHSCGDSGDDVAFSGSELIREAGVDVGCTCWQSSRMLSEGSEQSAGWSGRDDGVAVVDRA